jgi:hypothetical protein
MRTRVTAVHDTTASFGPTWRGRFPPSRRAGPG